METKKIIDEAVSCIEKDNHLFRKLLRETPFKDGKYTDQLDWCVQQFKLIKADERLKKIKI